MPIDRAAVLDAGVAVVRDEGLDALSMRSVAIRVGVTPMALYRHVGNAVDLHRGVLDRILAEVPDLAETGPWAERCRGWAHGARPVLARHPGVAHHVLRHWIHLPRALRLVDELGSMFAAHGPRGADPVAAANLVFVHVLARAQVEEDVRAAGLQRDLATVDALSEELPFLVQHREEYATAWVDEHFAYGLDAMLAGIAGLARQGRRAR